jgi:hypothetical protein
MSEHVTSVLANVFVLNDTDRASTKELLKPNASDFGQFSSALYGTAGFDFNQQCGDCTSSISSSSSSPQPLAVSNVDVDDKKRNTSKCNECNHDHQKPSNLMEKKIEDLKKKIKNHDIKKGPLPHLKSNDLLVSNNIIDHLTNKTIFIWDPRFLLPSGCIPHCWDPECHGFTPSNTTCINRESVEVRSVEGLKDVSFILYAQFKCSKCKSLKSSLDAEALELMGFPLAIVMMMPIVIFKHSAWEKVCKFYYYYYFCYI